MLSRTTEIAEDWLASKLVATRATNPQAADRARRDDLCRWGRAIRCARGEPVAAGRYDLGGDWGVLQLDELHAELLVRALAELRQTYSTATCARMLATLRTHLRWCVRRGHLSFDPTDDDQLAVVAPAATITAFSDTDVDALLAAAAAAPGRTERAWWPARDVAVLSVLADCGLRAAELCGLRDRDAEVDGDPAMLRVEVGAKGSRRREVPLPRRTCSALRTWRLQRDATLRASPPSAPLFVRHDGRPLTPQVLDRLVRRCAARGGVALQQGAAAHAFRHYYGVQLATRGVPMPLISELMGHADPRTTAIYTRAAGHRLTGALDDAGWL